MESAPRSLASISIVEKRFLQDILDDSSRLLAIHRLLWWLRFPAACLDRRLDTSPELADRWNRSRSLSSNIRPLLLICRGLARLGARLCPRSVNSPCPA